MPSTSSNAPVFQYDQAGRPTAIVTQSASEQNIIFPIRLDECLCPDFLQTTYRLTPRQARTVQLLFGRRTNKEIAEIMCITIFTARRHVEAVLYKLGTCSRFEIEGIVLRAYIAATHYEANGSETMLRESAVRDIHLSEPES